MSDKGSPEELDHCRRRAGQRVREGASTPEVAEFLGGDPRSVRRGVAAYRQEGGQGLHARLTPGRPSKVTTTPEKSVRRGWADPPTEPGFATDRWTGPRLAPLIPPECGIPLHPGDLSPGRHARGWTPPRPRHGPRQRDPEVIVAGRRTPWPRLKTRPDDRKPTSR